MEIMTFKEMRLKFLSFSVIITLTALIILQGLLYINELLIINLPQIVNRMIYSLSVIIGAFFFTSLILRLTLKRVYNIFDEPEERIFYSKIYSWSLYSIGVFVILYHFGVSLGNITIFIGLIATGLAFAVRDVLLSFFGWMILLRKKPFRIGDYISIGEDQGKVLHIGTFYVLLAGSRNFPEGYTRVPNRLFLEKSICHLGKKTGFEQITFQLSSIPNKKEKLFDEIKKNITSMPECEGYASLFTDMKDDKLMLIVEYTVDFEHKQKVKSEVIDTIIKLFKKNIIIPGK